VRIETALVVTAAWLASAGAALGQPAFSSASTSQPGGAVRPAAPRSREPGRAGSLEFSASALWLAPSSLGSAEADLTANDARGSAYRLFTASGEFGSAAGLEARAAYHLTRMFAVEGGITYSRPTVRVAVANDAEGAAAFDTAGETASQFFVDASLVAYLVRRGGAGTRVRPFLEAGAGYLRELHGQAGATAGYYSKDTGQVYHVGGGARYFFHVARAGVVRAYGVRFDGRYYFRTGGFTFDGSHAKTFTAGAGLVLAF
jgi:hypothetical protein